MNDMQEKLPIFVYGTLMEGFGNHQVVARFAKKIIPAKLDKARMHAIPNAFPFIVKDEELSVIGELVYIGEEEDEYEDALWNCDALEGYSENRKESFYNREKVVVNTEDGKVDAWVYFAGTVEKYNNSSILVEDGDYRKFVKGKFSAVN